MKNRNQPISIDEIALEYIVWDFDGILSKERWVLNKKKVAPTEVKWMAHVTILVGKSYWPILPYV